MLVFYGFSCNNKRWVKFFKHNGYRLKIIFSLQSDRDNKEGREEKSFHFGKNEKLTSMVAMKDNFPSC